MRSSPSPPSSLAAPGRSRGCAGPHPTLPARSTARGRRPLHLRAQPRRHDRRRRAPGRRWACRCSYIVSPAEQDRAGGPRRRGRLSGQLVWDYSRVVRGRRADHHRGHRARRQVVRGSFPSGQWSSRPSTPADTLEGVYHADSHGALPARHRLDQEAPGQRARRSSSTSRRWPSTASRSCRGSQLDLHGTVTGGMLAACPTPAPTPTRSPTTPRADDPPRLTFTQAHRVRTTVTLGRLGGQAGDTRQVLVPVRVLRRGRPRRRARPDETNENFTTAAEVRRL